MKLWLVIQQGIHFKGIVGIYDTYEQANDTAQICANTDEDDWHTWDVVPYTMNMSTHMETQYTYRPIDPIPLHSYKEMRGRHTGKA